MGSYGITGSPRPSLSSKLRAAGSSTMWDGMAITSAAPRLGLGDARLVLPGEDLQGVTPMVFCVSGSLTTLRNTHSSEGPWSSGRNGATGSCILTAAPKSWLKAHYTACACCRAQSKQLQLVEEERVLKYTQTQLIDNKDQAHTQPLHPHHAKCPYLPEERPGSPTHPGQGSITPKDLTAPLRRKPAKLIFVKPLSSLDEEF